MDSSSTSFRPGLGLALVGFAVLFGLALVGVRSLQTKDTSAESAIQTLAAPGGSGGNKIEDAAVVAVQRDGFATRTPGGPVLSPTADAPHALPAARTQEEQYTVQIGDSLAGIAQRFLISADQIVKVNNLSDPNHVEVGQQLVIPLPSAENAGSDFKILPDSELVNGPAAAEFDVAAFTKSSGGYLAGYSEEVDQRPATGAQIVKRIAQEYSVNPRLLLAVLEYQSGWVTRPNPPQATYDYPMRLVNTNYKGLYRQLSWAANQLNRGFYLWRVNGAGAWLLADGSAVRVSPLINAGTAGVQNLFALLSDRAGWNEAVSEGGVFETYSALFGYPFDYAVEPLQPTDLSQPELQLPFEKGKVWSFTGGPHGGWADGSAWAALDFAPPGEALGCVISDEWVTAVADGPVVRAGNGAVIQDLDSAASPADGLEQTGWTILYMHVDTRDRVEPGVYLKAGERVGHPSCEGGVSNGTHLHLARKYNGEWISADQPELPFVLDGWVSSGAGNEYDGYLNRDGKKIEAYAARDEINAIQR
jgi:LasA protease